jgi:cold shock CspA family protein
MQATIRTLRAARGFAFLQDSQGAEIFFRHSAVTPPGHFDALVVGMVVECEVEPSPKTARQRRSPSFLSKPRSAEPA